jgi:hypothetical protein
MEARRFPPPFERPGSLLYDRNYWRAAAAVTSMALIFMVPTSIVATSIVPTSIVSVTGEVMSVTEAGAGEPLEPRPQR